MFHVILYVSTSRLVMPAAEGDVQAIVHQSRRWNEEVGITGALVFTERHFAQCIEGPAAAIADLFAKLQRDPRHHHIDVVRRYTPGARRFDRWSLAYSGPELFVEPQLLPLLTLPPGAARERRGEELIRLMEALADATAG